MRLYRKIGVGILAVMASATALSGLIIALFFQPTYAGMDEATAEANASRAFGFFHSEAENLGATTRDWAHWDDTFLFAGSQNPTYVEDNLKPADLGNIEVDSFTLLDGGGGVIFHKRADPAAAAIFSAGAPLPDYARFEPSLIAEPSASREGLIVTPEGPAFASISPVLPSSVAGEPRGYLLFTRKLETHLAKRAKSETDVDFTLQPLGDAAADAGGKLDGSRFTLLATTPDDLFMGRVIEDLKGEPSYVFRVKSPRSFAAVGWQTLWRTIAALVALGLITAYAVAWMVGKLVTRPLETMASHMAAVAATGDLGHAIAVERSDEIGQLAGGFNRMIGDLKEARDKLTEQSYVSGMADLAAGVLHNVRNALSPMVAATWELRRILGEVSVEHLEKAGDELAAERVEDTRRIKIGGYVKAFGGVMSRTCEDVKGRVDVIATNCQNIQVFLKDHDELSRGPRAAEPVALEPLVAELARAVAPSIAVEIDASVAAQPPVEAQRYPLRHVIGNLFSNSLNAIAATGRNGGAIRVSARPASLGDRQAVELTVADDGKGFSTEESKKLFERGFTTRANGEGGHGLHWCATTLAGMKGRIRGESAGPGAGAAFHILLPVAAMSAPKESGR